MKKSIYILTILSIVYIIGCGSPSSKEPSDDRNNDRNDTNQSNNIFMSLKVQVPLITPSDEFVCINFDDLKSPIPMNLDYENNWKIDISADMIESYNYKYCRNCECGAADEYFKDIEISWRTLSFKEDTSQNDKVNKWRWNDGTYSNFALNENGYKTTKPSSLNKTDFMAGMMLIDWWKKDWMKSVGSTLAKIKNDTSSNWIQYTPIPTITQLYPTPLIVKNATNGTSDEDLIKIIQSTHAKGMKFFLNPSPWSFTEDNSSENHTQEWWNAYESQWRPIMLQYATLSEENGVEMLEFKMWPSIDGISYDESAKMNTLAQNLLDDVRAIYNGKIAVPAIMYDTTKPILDVQRNTDYISTKLWSYYPWHLANTKDDNVTQITTIIESKFDEFVQSYYENNVSKPIIIEQLSAKSYDGGMIEANTNDEIINPFYKNDSNWTIDLQEQADFYEASLNAISKRDYIHGTFAFTYFYWNSIDKDLNLRGKPASKVVSKWYKWMQ